MQEKTENNPDSPHSGAGKPGFHCVLGAWHDHEHELRRFLFRRLADRSAAEDLLHDVFIRAMCEGHGFCRLDNPRAWLFRVARNAAVDLERRKRPAVPVDEDLPTPESAPPAIDALHRCLECNLQLLEAPDREVLQACDLDGMRHIDFAREQGLSLPAVKSRVLRARVRLRALLVENCDVMFDDQGNVCCHAADASVSGLA